MTGFAIAMGAVVLAVGWLRRPRTNNLAPVVARDPEDGGPVCQDCGRVCFGNCPD